MYKFVKGSRLFMQGTREGADYDNVHDTFRPTMSAAVDRSRGGGSNNGNGHHAPAAGEDDDLGRAFSDVFVADFPRGKLWDISRDSQKSQFRQSLGVCTADFRASLIYKSAVQKHKHCLT